MKKHIIFKLILVLFLSLFTWKSFGQQTVYGDSKYGFVGAMDLSEGNQFGCKNAKGLEWIRISIHKPFRFSGVKFLLARHCH